MRQWLVFPFGLLVVAAVAAFASGERAPRPALGVILLHGKMGTPLDRRTGLAAIGHVLEANGELTSLPAMPWGPNWEHIDTGVPGSLARIDDIVAALRARGASRMVIVGHSLGADMGLAYAATRGGLAGLVMAAPGHRPEQLARRDQAMREAVAKARQMVEAGQGDARFVGPDGIQGYTLTLTTRAAIYLSWMDPQGLAAMEVQAPRLPSSIPLLMVVGRRDPFRRDAEATVFRPAARHPYSRYLPVGADHSTTPMAASSVIETWIDNLPR
jgi:pimeloyl-ACP methyl ester carboxylesterase